MRALISSMKFFYQEIPHRTANDERPSDRALHQSQVRVISVSAAVVLVVVAGCTVIHPPSPAFDRSTCRRVSYL